MKHVIKTQSVEETQKVAYAIGKWVKSGMILTLEGDLGAGKTTFTKGLAKGFSLETGLTYTLLSSDAKLAGEEQQIEQKLHYIGIPLRANWNFLDKKLVTLYVSGGGMVEKCVYGKLGSEKETVKPLQFSVSGGVGAQINATKRLGIYVEPGVAYYFNDGSDIQTIRKENPFNFNIQAGVRLTY